MTHSPTPHPYVITPRPPPPATLMTHLLTRPVSSPPPQVIKDVCDAHGAVAMKSSLIGAAHPSMPKQAPRLLAPGGGLLSLRHEMRYAFATWLAAQANLGG